MIRWHRGGDRDYWGQTRDLAHHFRLTRVSKVHWRLEHSLETAIGVWIDHGVFESKRDAQLAARDIATIN